MTHSSEPIADASIQVKAQILILGPSLCNMDEGCAVLLVTGAAFSLSLPVLQLETETEYGEYM